MGGTRRALHYVLRVGGLSRRDGMDFYLKSLGMKVLRHEEFEGGCAASCNGPYDNRWSKTMVGYGPEDDHFVLELTYNYSVSGYRRGNDLRRVLLSVSDEDKDPRPEKLTSPDGCYAFESVDRVRGRGKEVIGVELSCTDLDESLRFWRDVLGMAEASSSHDEADSGLRQADLSYGPDQAKVVLVQLDRDGPPLDRGTAFGRIAFSMPTDELDELETRVKAAGFTVATPRVVLATPGKADVVVIILADPDGHEVCFVGDEGFRQLSQVDPEAEQKLDEAIDRDKSNEWFSKHGRDKGTEA